MANLTVRIDENLKADAEKVLQCLGLTASEAVRLFFAQIRNTRSIPFELKIGDVPSEKLESILVEAEKEYKTGKLEHYNSVDDFIAAMNEDNQCER